MNPNRVIRNVGKIREVIIRHSLKRLSFDRFRSRNRIVVIVCTFQVQEE